MSEPHKKDLIKAFGLENMGITPATCRHDTQDQILQRTPHKISEEIQLLIEEIKTHLDNSDIDSIIECCKAMQMRTNILVNVAEKFKRDHGL